MISAHGFGCQEQNLEIHSGGSLLHQKDYSGPDGGGIKGLLPSDQKARLLRIPSNKNAKLDDNQCKVTVSSTRRTPDGTRPLILMLLSLFVYEVAVMV